MGAPYITAPDQPSFYNATCYRKIIIEAGFELGHNPYQDELGTDATAKGNGLDGLEFRSKVFSLTGNDINYYKKLLEFFRSKKCKNMPCSGLHIHISRDENFTDEEFTAMYDYIDKIKGIKKKRLGYCEKEKNLRFRETNRYNRIRAVSDNHIEFRVFNSTLQFDTLKKCYNHVMRALELAEKVVEDKEKEIDSLVDALYNGSF